MALVRERTDASYCSLQCPSAEGLTLVTVPYNVSAKGLMLVTVHCNVLQRKYQWKPTGSHATEASVNVTHSEKKSETQ